MATSFAYDKNGNLVEQNEYDWVSSFPASGSAACNLPGSNPIRNTSYTHWAPPRNSGGSRILATEGDPLPAEYKNAQNAYWSMSAPAKRDSILDVRVSGGTAANPTPLVVQSVTQFEYDNHAISGQVVRHDVPQLVEPEQRHLGQDFSLAGDGLTHDHVEGRQPVAGDHQQPVAADRVVVAHLAACKQGQAVKAGFEQGRSHGAVDGREQMGHCRWRTMKKARLRRAFPKRRDLPGRSMGRGQTTFCASWPLA